MTTQATLQEPQVQAILLWRRPLLIYGMFALYPMLDVIVMSFQKWNGLDPERVFVGLDNYRTSSRSDPVFWVAFRNTLIWTLARAVVFPPLIGLLLALGLNQNDLRAAARCARSTTCRSSSPRSRSRPCGAGCTTRSSACSASCMTNLGLQRLDPGLARRPRRSRSTRSSSRYVWQSVGFSMVLFLAGLQGVSQTLVEAARIDGAGRWGVFRHVTLPALRTTITIVLVLSVINSLKAFDIVYGLTGGGPAQSTQMLALWAFTQAMQIFDFGRGGAISVVLLLITVAIVIPYLRWTQRREEAAR